MPGPVANKNLPIASAGLDLGLGDQLTQQLQDTEEELRKRKLRMQQGLGTPGLNSMSLASMSLGLGGAGG